ncbi:zinc metallopeptidase [Luteolibacter flavescens]|uniref:Zinc metallopeptidase n=1 Tax=Luteolibacter flavescens TaxID=1859460 RepID=A0ABT3FQV2_9BACT|nr:zinc metallopeptidase [Luteolibacter flavescens]MCW1885957.1 zinc metallopeptidase [Luteolibacter flavescens]
MWKILLILSLIPLVGAGFGRHWFWTRIRMKGLRRDCGLTVRELREKLGLPPGRGRRGMETHAAALGNALRECGLALLEKEGNTMAKARVKGAFLTKALPALVMMIAVFAILSKRVSAGWAISGAVATVAFWTLLRLTGLPIELRAAARGAEALKASRAVKRVSDEDEIVRCAKASVWSTVWPF